MKPGDKVWFEGGTLRTGTILSIEDSVALIKPTDFPGTLDMYVYADNLWTNLDDAIHGCRAEAEYWLNKARELERT